MRPLPSLQPTLPVAWAHVLDKVDETLRKTEAAAAEREQAVGSVSRSSDAEEERMTQWAQSLQRLEEQGQGRPTAARQAEKEAAKADAALKAGEEALARWLSDAEVVERRLAKWVKPEV